ncbi:MAG TPA: hypothetical protein PLA50_01890 [Bacteroidia bacterium]|nr:hypothetical protein [Bacteroidia bacterium]
MSVFAEGDIVLRSGTSLTAAVMIGHGGYGAFGPMEGDIKVVSRNGSLELDSTLATRTAKGGVMIGHGSPSPGSGTRQGDILVDVAGEISMVAAAANLSFIGHKSSTANAISNADLTIRARSFDRVTGDSGSQLLRLDSGLATMLIGNLTWGHTSLVGMGSRGIETDLSMIWTSTYDFNLIAYSDIYIANHLVNRGDGDVNVFAGWNPELAPLHAASDFPSPGPSAPVAPWRGYMIRNIDADTQIFDVPGTTGEAYGHGGGSVYVGAYADFSAADRAVSVASRTGQTNVAGYDVNVWGPSLTGGINQGAQRYAQIGYNRVATSTATSLAATGRIRVGAANDINLVANKYEVGTQGSNGWTALTDNAGNASYAQIGHGGDRNSVRDMELSGDIVVEAGGNLSLLGGRAYNNHATIGHGGYDNRDTTFPGVASIKGGDIGVTVGGDVLLQAGLGYHANVQIGHGGGQIILADFVESKITVNAGGDVTVKGGAGVAGVENNSRAQAQIGHGGYDADFVDAITGTVRTAGSGYGYKGDIEVTAGGAVLVQAGNHDSYNLAAIGNGGVGADGDHRGAITVTAGAGIELRSGTGASYNLAQIGHFAYAIDTTVAGHGNLSGEITVKALGGALILQSVDSTVNANPVLIGHGGILSNGKRTGTIDVTAANGVSVLAGSGADTLFAQIGHLSYRSLNEIDGQVTVISQDGGIRLQGGGLGNKAASYAVIGSSGGYDPTAGTTISGGTKVVSLGTDPEDGIVLKSGNDSYSSAHIGHLAQRTSTSAVGSIDLSGDVVVEIAAGGLQMQSSTIGTYSHTMIGHGGSYATGSKSGDIRVTVTSGNLSAKAGGTTGGERYNHTQIGHGGYIRAGAVTASSGTGFEDIFDDDGNKAGERPLGIVVRVLGGDIELLAGGAIANYAQIGHGGIRASVANTSGYTGDITVEASGSIDMGKGSASYTHAKIGHGGTDTVTGNVTNASGAIAVTAGGNIDMGEGTASYAYSQIGHGGPGVVSNNVWHLGGAIDVTAGGSVIAKGGSVTVSNVQIGHGGYASTTDSSIAASPVTVRATTGDVLLLSGTASNTGAKIGHGGYNMKLSSFGDSPVTVEAGRHVRLISPQYETFTAVSNSGTQIGHGGFGAIVGPVSGASDLGYRGDITVSAGGKLDVIAGKNAGSYNWSLLGHTSYFNSNGVHRGNITVTTGTLAGLAPADYGITVQAAYGDYMPIAGTNTTAGYYYSFASIGHRGHSNSPSTSSTGLHGDILVDAVRGGITVTGGDGVDGSTAADTPPDIRLNGASIGHGGYQAGHLVSGISGSVSVFAEGDIVLRSGTSRHAAVMIGHGGYGAFGPMEGDIKVVSWNGSLELNSILAINATRGGVMIGHGSPSPGAGTRQGDILVDVAGEISLVGGFSYIGHRTTGTISNADLTIRARSFDRAAGDSGSQLFRSDGELSAMLAANLTWGHTSLVGMGSQGIEMAGAMSWDSPYDFNLLSYSNIHIANQIGNRGVGDVSVVAGWNPELAPLHTVSDFPPPGPSAPLAPWRGYMIRDVNAATDLIGVADAYGNHNGTVTVGASTSSSSVGSSAGATTVLGYAVNLLGSDTAGGGYAQIGATPAFGTSSSGAIVVKAREGGVTVEGGDRAIAYAQIGHRAVGSAIPFLSSDILVDSQGGLTVRGGAGVFASAQIGHGGNSITTDIGGTVTVKVADSIDMAGGSMAGAYAQIGHGGLYTKGSFGGRVEVDAGGSILMSAPNLAGNAYAKVGHGDDVRGGASGAGTGHREGDIKLTAEGGIAMKGALVGHVNGDSPATAVSGKTWIALVDEYGNPLTDPSVGGLKADASSEFYGADEVRFYLPSRANNQVSAGAQINGEVYVGGVDPWPVQREDEYTNNRINEDGTVDFLGQWAFPMGIDPAPVVAGRYAFYYDVIEIGQPPVVVVPVDLGAGASTGAGSWAIRPVRTEPDYRRMTPDDRTYDEWLSDRKRGSRRWTGYEVGSEGSSRRWLGYEISFEGYSQYGPHGESVYEWKKKREGEEE